MKKNSDGVRFGAICIGLTVCVVEARRAQAQHALGDGQALDRNLSTQGPRNTPVRDLNALIRFNNAVVTGNAVGGRAFRGDVGYLASDDFRAPTGTDALYQFRRDASSTAIVASGIRGTDALQYQFALSTGQAPPPVLGNFADTYNSGLGRGANPIHRPDVIQSIEQKVTTGSTAAGALRSTADYNAQQALRPSVLAYRQDPEGRKSMLTASPLTGLNWTNMGAGPANSSNPDNPASSSTPGAAGDQNNRSNTTAAPLSGLESIPSYLNNPIGLVQSMAPSRVDTRPKAPQTVMNEIQRVMDENAKKKKAADDKSAAARPGEGPERLAGVPNLLDDELDRMRKRLGGFTDDEPKKETKPGDAPADDKVKDPRPMSLRELVDPTTGKFNQDVLKALQTARPTIVSFVPEAPKQADTYAAHMARGESLLGAGKYYDAEDSFVRALALQPNDTLASVGRINAQLGAGAFVSTATNLKALFTAHPEMIGTRYAPSLMPSLNTGDARAMQLRFNIKDPSSGIGKEAGMLLAYLGYQRNDPKMIKDGIDAMAAKTYPEQTGDVALLGLLEKIWIQENTPPADQNK